jgi:hypothetical protein
MATKKLAKPVLVSRGVEKKFVADRRRYRSSHNLLKNRCRTLARCSISASSFGSTQTPLCAIRLA